ncbi:cell envelope-like transcriptional attenuator domain-containing protein [Clostridium putrefaciens]|uniref:Cell envelope-like transcriptional attenuator domain-containing protein n=1 Tax=Clostridium putrefaciens TaxID=99675 RepID=A0A381J4D1_9CLOT|nr:LCP family protein [Clostridium putrefaciens]SUY45664.1 cell envelope-like transcriptional attenuator domain-containing protein [Clostridium putrefaciens]
MSSKSNNKNGQTAPISSSEIRKGSNRNTIKRNKIRRKKRRIITCTFIFILLFLIGFGTFYVSNLLSKVKTNVISKDVDDLGIHSDVSSSFTDPDIINIALFGLDKTSNDELGRSDATMVVTIDKKNDKLKMSSIMRDSYVDIDGHGKDKLNHAHAFGGPQLAIKTINKNYKLNIKDYVSVNFSNMEKLIDALGGVNVDVKREEVNEINITTVGSPTSISRPGLQKLNGKQALAYSRIRHVGNGDFERTDRQRVVLNSMFEIIKTSGASQYPSIVAKLLPLVETSLSKTDIIKLGTGVLMDGKINIEQERFPVDGYFKDGGEIIKDVWYLPFDSKVTIKQMQDYIFNDIKPQPKTN